MTIDRLNRYLYYDSSMKIKLMILFSIILAVSIGAIVVYIPFKQEKDRLANEAKISKQTATTLKSQVADMQKREAAQIETEKQAALLEKKAGTVYFTAKSTPLAGGDTQIDITLKGEDNVSVDATDLVIAYPSSVEVKEIQKGKAFPSYPRALSKNGNITITGIAMPVGSSITYGKINELFATIIVNKKPNTMMDINTKDTQAYFNGEPILDFVRSFKEL